MPPGGPPDVAAPTLIAVTPDSGSVNTKPSSVVFRFSEVVSERPRNAQTLAQLVVISPSDGPPDVSWGRDRVIVRPRHGWRPDMAYTVTVLPGLADLRGNVATESFNTVFSTGATIPDGVVRGVAFDWMGGKVARAARIEATIGSDTLLRYSIAADSGGRFALTSLPPSAFVLTAWMDANGNGIRDSREPWDTVSVTVSDSVRHELYLFPHDTIGARIADVAVADSVTIRVKFDHGLRDPAPIELSQFRLFRARDSTEITLSRLQAAPAYDSAAATRREALADSIARADTSERGRREVATADSLRRVRSQRDSAQAQIGALRAARDTTKLDTLPTLGRPVPPTEFVIITAEPLEVDVPLRIVVTDVQALVGPPRTSERQLMRRRPAPADTTGRGRPPPRGPS